MIPEINNLGRQMYKIHFRITRYPFIQFKSVINRWKIVKFASDLKENYSYENSCLYQ